MARTRIMGILNLTPDSFYDGGRYTHPRDAIQHGYQMLAEGADIIDIGGESTRPGAVEIPAEVECERVCAVVEALSRDCLVSIDTRHEQVARAAVHAGARLINDISGSLAPVAAGLGVGWVAMHMRGTPATMQVAPHYDDVVAEVTHQLLSYAETAERLGVPEVLIDPGLGFGKTTAHNLALVEAIDVLAATGYPVLVGASRKSFIGEVLGVTDPGQRLAGSLAIAVAAVARGAAVIRTHDVAPTRQAVLIAEAVNTPALARR
ncbi:dihydropteroate synthase [Nocardia grenadensis]|uniref:dihydropteroate synthase n=1 Tax=Nocardia grenadensis TaxID=931537 RepID=UPI0007A3F245|nr:dihydropteroate synthase [Nocardia grenadensis]